MSTVPFQIELQLKKSRFDQSDKNSIGTNEKKGSNKLFFLLGLKAEDVDSKVTKAPEVME
jgi:hypothetical protein